MPTLITKGAIWQKPAPLYSIKFSLLEEPTFLNEEHWLAANFLMSKRASYYSNKKCYTKLVITYYYYFYDY